SVMRGRGPCARRMLRQILPYLTGGPPSALRSAAGNAPVGESALHAHRGRAVHVRAKARHDRESVSAVERHRGELLVACLEAQPVDVVIDGIVDQGGDERVRDARTTAFGRDEEALELARAVVLQLQSAEADQGAVNAGRDQMDRALLQ